MAVSKAQICNLALAHIKQTKTTIANLDTDTGTVANQLRLHYDVARKFVLTDHDWNFCGLRVTLADVGSPPATWSYRYDYPSNAIKMRSIQRLAKTDTPVPYRIELLADGSKKSILSDLASAIGVFTADVENVGLFSPGFVSSLSWYLASEISPALSGDDKNQEAALTVYRNILAASQAIDSNEGEPDPDLSSPWERARIGGQT